MSRKKRNNILAIGDLHAPFTLDEYFKFCKRLRRRYKPDTIIFLGDLIENNYTSFHDTNPDGHSAGAELERAIKMIDGWYQEFPEAIVLIGNHDRRPQRKAFNAGISKHWIKTVDEVLDTPGWIYEESIIIDNVMYCHGEQRRAHIRARDEMISVVQGHWHVDSKITYYDGPTNNIFAMQVGCGFDRNSYAAEYAKFGKMQSHSAGVVLQNGKLPILERMI